MYARQLIVKVFALSNFSTNILLSTFLMRSISWRNTIVLKEMLFSEIQFGSHVHMLPMLKIYISECQKIQTKKFHMYIFIIYVRS
jgi:hypothetical protein